MDVGTSLPISNAVRENVSIANSTRSFRDRINSPITDSSSTYYNPLYPNDSHQTYRIRTAKRDPMFPRAKIIYVWKFRDTELMYYNFGKTRRMRTYCINVMTDEDRYYYNLYTTISVDLSETISVDLAKVFLDGYIIDENTLIVLSKDMYKANDPICTFFTIVVKTINHRIRYMDTYRVLHRLNLMLGMPIKYHRKGQTCPTPWSVPSFMRRLDERGVLGFLTDGHRKELDDERNVPDNNTMSAHPMMTSVVVLATLRLLYNDIKKKRKHGRKVYTEDAVKTYSGDGLSWLVNEYNKNQDKNGKRKS